MNTLDELRAWGLRMRRRTCRQIELQGGAPAGWHVLLPDGDFGFLDVTPPTTAEEHAVLVQEVREYMREMRVRACLFSMERAVAEGSAGLFCQYEAVAWPAGRERSMALHPIRNEASGRWVDEGVEIEPASADADMLRYGMFPDLLPEPASPLRIL
jgi:hypothetical protein